MLFRSGAGRYDEHLSRGRPLPLETRAYLARLASITGGGDDGQGEVIPPPDPFAWRRSALFVRVSNVADGVAAVQVGGEIAASEPSAASPSETLFVPRARAGRPQ